MSRGSFLVKYLMGRGIFWGRVLLHGMNVLGNVWGIFHSKMSGGVLGEFFGAVLISHGECLGNIPRLCLDPHAGLQVCVCRGYRLSTLVRFWHFGLQLPIYAHFLEGEG